MYSSKLTQKSQINIPRIILRKASPFDFAYHEALESTVPEWNSKEDNEAFSDSDKLSD